MTTDRPGRALAEGQNPGYTSRSNAKRGPTSRGQGDFFEISSFSLTWLGFGLDVDDENERSVRREPPMDAWLEGFTGGNGGGKARVGEGGEGMKNSRGGAAARRERKEFAESLP